jgi:ribonucleoside-diphosphate reductase alpha chain
MVFSRVFTKPLSGPYKGIVWDCRKSDLRNSEGKIIFSMDNVIVPSSWSQIASDILAQKYFRKAGVPKEKEFAWKEYLDHFSRPEKDEHTLFELKNGFAGSEYDARQVFHRLAYSWLQWGKKEKGMFDSEEDEAIFYEETLYMLANQIAAPNSPQWFNTGLYDVFGISGPPQGHYYYDKDKNKVVKSKSSYERSQTSACFILPVKDALLGEDGIFDTVTKEARLFKYGSGAGSNFSNIRGKNEKLSGGGVSSGLLSFLKINDASASAIKSGGTTRRASKIDILDVDHPDIKEFIEWKPKEEYKVSSLVVGSTIIKRHVNEIRIALESFKSAPDLTDDMKAELFNVNVNTELRRALYEALQDNVPENYLYQLLRHYEYFGNFDDIKQFSVAWGDEAYETVSGQSANNTVRVTDKFLNAVKDDLSWDLIERTTGKTALKIKAKDIWDNIITAAWKCADPGLQFHDTINKWHTCPEAGPITASNPCGEFTFIDSTACNLASINLLALYYNGQFNIDKYIHTIHIWTTILEISIQMAHFPAEEMAKRSYDYRPLGLGFAGLGSLLMTMGYPYDSNYGRIIAGCLSSILGAEAYCTSALMAERLGSFSEFKNNKEAMLNVIDMHRKANLNLFNSIYDNDHIVFNKTLEAAKSEFIQNKGMNELYRAAAIAWDRAYALGNEYGFRNAQVTCIAPTGTIGLLMDCDTTGIEPDFALVKYKTLAGGGSFKIINKSISTALQNLGYNYDEIIGILTYIVGKHDEVLHNVIDLFELGKKPHHKAYIHRQVLNEEGMQKLSQFFDELVRTSSSIDDLFGNFSDMDEDDKKTLSSLFGINIEHLEDPKFNLSKYIGLYKNEIEAIEEYLFGTMTIEGAPHLKKEHYSVFDTASLCGKKGTRCINWQAHVLMMAAVQPFISGAISKTINMPSSASYNDIKDAYIMSWTLGLKSITVYRDQSKLSQPLYSFLNANSDAISKAIITSRTLKFPNNDSDGFNKDFLGDLIALQNKKIDELEKENKELKQKVNNQNHRTPLPTRRNGHIQKTKIGGHSIFLHTGEYEDGKLGEIFIDMHREGAAFRSLLNSFAIAISLGLQYGVPLEEYVDAFVFSKFEPNGVVQGHKYIKMVTSVIDYIFRDLAITYLDRKDLGQVKKEDLNITDMSSSRNSEKAKDKHIQSANEIIKLMEKIIAEEIGKNQDAEDAKTVIKKMLKYIIDEKENNGKANGGSDTMTLEDLNKAYFGEEEYNNMIKRYESNKSAEEEENIEMCKRLVLDINKKQGIDSKKDEKEPVFNETENNIKSARLRGYEGDPCPNCGSFTLVRNGSCTKCTTCGSTTGCS